jgi:hypothetical protein
MTDIELGRLFAEAVEQLDGRTYGLSLTADRSGAIAAIRSLGDVGSAIVKVVSDVVEIPHLGWVDVHIENLLGATLAFPPNAAAFAAVEGVDGPARIRFSDGSEVSYAVGGPDGESEPEVAGGPSLPRLGSRLSQLGAHEWQVVNFGVEPLMDAGRRLLDDHRLDCVDAAEIQALVDAVRAELYNPRPDVIAVERAVARLAAAVAERSNKDAATDQLSDALKVHPVLAESVSELVELPQTEGLGDPDDERDWLAASALLEVVKLRLDEITDDVQRSLEREPNDELSRRLERIEARLELPSAAWPRALAQNLTAAAIWSLAFDALGLGGIALKAVVWVLIAIYGLV